MMLKIFGDKAKFACSVERLPEEGNAFLHGRFCYWIDGQRVGDFDIPVSLVEVTPALKWMVKDAGQRAGQWLCGLPKDEVYLRLDRVLYGQIDVPDEWHAMVPQTPARFDLTIPCESMDGWKVFVVECEGRYRVLYKYLDDPTIHEKFLALDEVESVVEASYRFIEALM